MNIKKLGTGLLILTIIFLPLTTAAQNTRGVGVKVKQDDGQVKDVKLYKASYALVIGVADYTGGWQDLPGVRTDVQEVTAVLKTQGFQVTTVLDPKKAELSAALEKFINTYGYDYENRLLFYYAGHGITLKAGAGYEQGFIVPADAPALKSGNEVEVRRFAVSMDTIERYAGEINAKHALFVFDSCFSGALITKTRSAVPPSITFKATQPVRQFITAGSDDQEVPDISEFRKQFVIGLNGEADRNSDGYITASELADFLMDKVSRYTRGAQTPQYGKIRDARLDKGDFVFVTPGTNKTDNSGQTKPDDIDPNAGERGAWELIKESRNRSDYELFLKTFPSGIYAAQARAKYELVWWDSIKGSSIKAEFEVFLTRFPTGQFAAAARFAIQRMEKPDAKYQKAIFFNKTWLTQNLNEPVPGSVCSGKQDANCASSGRLYTFDDAKKACAGLGDSWRLPNRDDWLELTRRYGGAYGDNFDGKAAYQQLARGGNAGFNGSFGGKQIFISGGFYFYDFGLIGYYWVDENDPGNSGQAKMITFRSTDNLLLYEGIPKTDYISCRCVKD